MRIKKKKILKNNLLKDDLQKIIYNCRRGEYSDAASRINLFLPFFQNYLNSGTIPPEKLKKIAYSLETVLLLQQQRDWVAVADVLEYEIQNQIS